MRKSKFSPTQIAKILKEFEPGKSVHDITRDHGVSSAAFYKWRSKYAGMSSKELKRLKSLEDENRKHKQMYDYNHFRRHDALENMPPIKYAKIKSKRG